MNVLIIRPDGIGDVLLSLPVATQLRQLMPGVRIGFLTSPEVAPLLDHHPDVDYVRTVRFTDSGRVLRQAFTGGVDTAIFLKPFRSLMWAAWLARVPIRVATGYRWYSVLANRRVYEHRSEFSEHESHYNVALVTALGLQPQRVAPPKLVVSQMEWEAGARRWSALPNPRVVIHPGGMSARRWRPEHYRDLTIELARRGYGVTLTGSEAERAAFNSTLSSRELPETGINNLMGILSIRELLAVIANAHVVVSGATGPAHMAAAIGVPTVSLFDPRRNNSPVRWKPLGNGVLLRPDVPTCDKCLGETCSYWDCLDRFTVAKVMTVIDHVIKTPTSLNVIHV